MGEPASIEERTERGTMRRSLHASKSFSAGELICSFGIEKQLSKPNRLTLQIGGSKHALMKPNVLQSTNHSCSPNSFFNVEQMVLEALGPIEEGEEITVSYLATEWFMNEPFDCECGSQDCLKSIQGAKGVDEAILSKYRTNPHIDLLRKGCLNEVEEKRSKCLVS